jgi:hypothetical protein
MVREGYGTSGDNGATIGANALKGDRAEVLPLLARDHNLSSVPGSDVENGHRASDAGSGNDGRAPKNGRGRGALHGEVLLATKTVKKKPYKSLGWSLIAVRPDPDPLADAERKPKHPPRRPARNPRIPRPNAPTPRARARISTPRAPSPRAHPTPTPNIPSPPSPSLPPDPPAQAAASGILVACMVAAAVVPFSSVGPVRRVDDDTATMMREHMGSDAIEPLGDARASTTDAENAAENAENAAADADRLAPLTPGRFARAVGAASPADGEWPAKLVVVPAVFDEWDIPQGRSVKTTVPAWARPDPAEDHYVVSDLYQRRFEASPGFVPNRAYETAVYLKFIVDNYDTLPDVTAFVRGNFHRDVADAKQRLVRVAKRADRVAYQPLGVPEARRDADDALGLVESRAPGELVQMWKDKSWGWEDIMGDTAGAAAAHVSRCWRGLVDEFAEFTVDEKKTLPEEKRTAAAATGAREARRARRARAQQKRRQSELGQFFYPTSGGRGATTSATSARPSAVSAYPVVSEEDKAELAKPPVTVSTYGGDNFAVSRERLTRVPLETWTKLYDRLVTRGECLTEGAETSGRDEIRDKFDLGVGLEHLAHVIFGGMPADAGEAARCCGATCVLRDAACGEDAAESADDEEEDVAAVGRREEQLSAQMEAIEAKIARHNGWNLVGLRAERAAMGEAAASAAADAAEAADAADDVVPLAAIGAFREGGASRGGAEWRKILDGEAAKISAGELELDVADAADAAVAKKKLEMMLDDALREADRLREQVRQLDGDADVSDVARLSAREEEDDEFERILSVAKSTFDAQEREKRALRDSIDDLKRGDEETKQALEARLDALAEDVERKKRLAETLRARVGAAAAGSKAAERDAEKNRELVDELTAKLANTETRLTRVRKLEKHMEARKNIAAERARVLRSKLRENDEAESGSTEAETAETKTTKSAAAAAGKKEAKKAPEAKKAKASVPVEKKEVPKKTVAAAAGEKEAKKAAKPAADAKVSATGKKAAEAKPSPHAAEAKVAHRQKQTNAADVKVSAAGKKTSSPAEAPKTTVDVAASRKAERRATRAKASAVGAARETDEAEVGVAKLAMPRRGNPGGKAHVRR